MKTADKFRLKTLQCIAENGLIKDKSSVLICLSGGADSVSLLHVMISLRDRLGIDIQAIHINHMLRGSESDRDEDFCRELCHELNIELTVERTDIKMRSRESRESIELAARNARYEIFEKNAKSKNIDYIITAHNADDNSETMLLNIIRGTSSAGLSGIPLKRGNIIRPLLFISRKEIIEYLETNKYDYINDSTNSNSDYTRNYIRNDIIPRMKKINPSFTDAIKKLSLNLRSEEDYFNDIMDNIDNEKLFSYHPAVISRYIVKKAKEANKDLFLDNITINKIINSVKSKKSSCFDLNKGFCCIVQNGIVLFDLRANIYKNHFSIEKFALKTGNNILMEGIVEIFLSYDIKNFNPINNFSTINMLTSVNIDDNVFVRNRNPGDKILLNGMTKSLKKEFINKKIPVEYREIIPVICSGEKIVCVPFIGVADEFKISNGNVTFVNISFEKNIYNLIAK